MEQINAQIPLSGYTAADYEKQQMTGLEMQNMRSDLQQKQQAIAQQKALQQALQGVDTSTIQGQQEAVQKARMISPDYAMKLEKNFNDQNKTRSEVTKNEAAALSYQQEAKTKQLEESIKKMEVIGREGQTVLQAYQDARTKELPEEVALKQAESAHITGLTNLLREGVIDTDKFKQMVAQPFNINQAKQGVGMALSTKDQLTQQLEKMKAEQTQKNQDAIRAETARHNKAEESIQMAREKREAAKDVASSPEAVDEVAKSIAEYRQAPMSGYALRSPFGQKVMARVNELNPKYNAIDYGVKSKAQKDFSTGKQGQAVKSFNVAIDHLATLDDLATALNNNDTRMLNKAKNSWQEQTGSSLPTNFDAAKKIVADEIVKAIVGSGGGVADREEAARTVDKANSPEQLKGVISTYKKLMSGQLHGLRKQYEVTTGRNDFDNMLTDQAKKETGSSKEQSHPADIEELLKKYGK